jgi:hypothetical protein
MAPSYRIESRLISDKASSFWLLYGKMTSQYAAPQLGK